MIYAEEAKVLNYNDLVANFSDPVEIGNGVTRCKDVLPKITFYYYVKVAKDNASSCDLLVVSENRIDDAFALFIFSNVPELSSVTSISAHALPANKFEFSTLILASKNYHAYFKGRLDDKRDKLILCLPVHKSEFVGSETVDEFIFLRREIVPTLDWERKVSPKIALRFDNPITGGGTAGSNVLVKYNVVEREVNNLNGVVSGFIEISNYMGKVIEILSPEPDQYILIHDRDDTRREVISKDKLLDKIWKFLIE